MYSHILVALDGSKLAERILPYVEPLARAFNARITLLRASTPAETIAVEEATAGMPPVIIPAAEPGRIASVEHQDAVAYLTALAQRLAAQGLTVDWDQPEGPPGESILAYAERLGADLIAMTTHGRGGIARVVLGSVADEVVRRATCPLLTSPSFLARRGRAR